ncbi:hypothetical protein EDB92DRAFT_1006090 [Lactarius akahatsu]|uniref:Uncharacterized protein n=1 Tax=Lactarius akahatsu TaxID=416441 RepID=A0AAD4Q9D7_9AGAM|nr:hypothetical protein EDB92DRAFT_1006090 [Lactarius akahatsu]
MPNLHPGGSAIPWGPLHRPTSTHPLTIRSRNIDPDILGFSPPDSLVPFSGHLFHLIFCVSTGALLAINCRIHMVHPSYVFHQHNIATLPCFERWTHHITVRAPISPLVVYNRSYHRCQIVKHPRLNASGVAVFLLPIQQMKCKDCSCKGVYRTWIQRECTTLSSSRFATTFPSSHNTRQYPIL